METIHFRLTLTPGQYLAYYRGAARQVLVRAQDGRRIRFPAEWLRRFVTAEGVQGAFRLRIGADHRLIDLSRIGD